MKILSFLIMLILLASSAQAFGIAPSRTKVAFEPGFSREYDVKVINDEKANASVGVSVVGELSEFVDVITPRIELNSNKEYSSINFRISLPKTMEYGKHKAELRLTRYLGGDGISANIMLAHPIIVDVPAELSHVSAKLYVDEKAIYLNLSNPKEDAENVSLALSVLDGDKHVFEYQLTQISIPGKTSKSIRVEHELKQGEYLIKCNVTSEQIIESSKKIQIGKPDATIEYQTPVFYAGEINPLNVHVTNNWNKEFTTKFRTILRSGEKTISSGSSENFNLGKYQSQDIKLYIDAAKAKPGLYQLKLELNFGDNIKSKQIPIGLIKRENSAPRQSIPLWPVFAFIALILIIAGAVYYVKQQKI